MQSFMKIGLKKFTEDAFQKLQKYCLKNITSLTSEFVRVFIKKLKLFLKEKKVYFVSKEGYALQLCCLWRQV